MADFSETLGELEKLVSERTRSNDSNQHIHVAWVCIMEDSRRVEQADEELVKMLTDRNIPIIAVITKIRSKKSDKGFRNEVIKLLPDVKNAVRVRALEEEDDDEKVFPTLGLDVLVDSTMEIVPEGLKRAFTAAQKVDIELKKTKSHKIVVGLALSAAGIGAAPIPFADAVMIVPIQVAMLAGISATFGLSIDESFFYTTIGSVISGVGGTLAGKAIAANLLKMLPGAGSVAGGVIAGATAGLLTTTIGDTYITVLVKLFKDNNGEQPKPEEVADAFNKLVIRRN